MRTKIVLLLACLAVGVNAISSYSPYKIYQQTDTLTHANLDSNLLRGSNWSSQLVDTLDKKFIRFTDVKDSTFDSSTVTDLKVTDDATIDDDLAVGGDVNITGGLKFDGGDLMTVYEEGSFPCTTQGLTTYEFDLAYYTKIGRQVTILFPTFTGISDSSGYKLTFGNYIDENGLRPVSIPAQENIVVYDNSSTTWGVATISTISSRDYVEITKESASSFTATGTKGNSYISFTFFH